MSSAGEAAPSKNKGEKTIWQVSATIANKKAVRMRGPAVIVMVSGFIPPAPLSNIIAHAQAGWGTSGLGELTETRPYGHFAGSLPYSPSPVQNRCQALRSLPKKPTSQVAFSGRDGVTPNPCWPLQGLLSGISQFVCRLH
jgi:hypothetical protein